jgi:hypothetical protein
MVPLVPCVSATAVKLFLMIGIFGTIGTTATEEF